MQILNMAFAPVCGDCHHHMAIVELKLDEQAAIVECANKGCKEVASRYRIVVPSFYGDPVYAS